MSYLTSGTSLLIVSGISVLVAHKLMVHLKTSGSWESMNNSCREWKEDLLRARSRATCFLTHTNISPSSLQVRKLRPGQLKLAALLTDSRVARAIQRLWNRGWGRGLCKVEVTKPIREARRSHSAGPFNTHFRMSEVRKETKQMTAAQTHVWLQGDVNF